MSTETHPSPQPMHHALRKRVWRAIKNNWQLKLLSLLVACRVGASSVRPNLTREKTFTDVPLTVTG